jgi:D-alanine-D-alanine ligase
MTTKKVGLIFGGVSQEHDISLATGVNAFETIPRDRYSVQCIYISKTGEFAFGKTEQAPRDVMNLETQPVYNSVKHFEDIDVVFNALHGPFGEDGTIQAFLQVLGIPCTGSPLSSSALAMDKMRARMVMQSDGIPVPESIYLSSDYKSDIPFTTVVVKPNSNGSSYGISIAKSPDEIKKAIDEAFRFDDIVIVEEYLAGKEITCPVIDRGNGDIEALPVILIEPQVSEFFNLPAKYKKGGSIETTPAPISEKVTQLAQKLALQTHKLIGCKGVTRTDMFILPDESIKIIEINTLPGMTDTSLVPQSAQVIGIDISHLLEIIIEEALNR